MLSVDLLSRNKGQIRMKYNVFRFVFDMWFMWRALTNWVRIPADSSRIRPQLSLRDPLYLFRSNFYLTLVPKWRAALPRRRPEGRLPLAVVVQLVLPRNQRLHPTTTQLVLTLTMPLMNLPPQYSPRYQLLWKERPLSISQIQSVRMQMDLLLHMLVGRCGAHHASQRRMP